MHLPNSTTKEHLLGMKEDILPYLRQYRLVYGYIVGGFLFLIVCLNALLFMPPLEPIQYPQVFIVPKGETIRSVGKDLQQRGVIVSPSLFVLANRLYGNGVVWGSYNFAEPRGVFFYGRGLYLGERNMPLRKITIPERSDAYAIADIFEKEFENFNREEFLELALKQHGYLYPDTYLFAFDYISAQHLLEIMTENFKQQTIDLFASYTGDLSEDEIIILASIVELEASRYDDRRKIAQVLLNRLEINMPLQVDVSFIFIEDKNTFQLSREDLDSDNPSNTYKYAGIPPIPITNPSRASVEAVMNPIVSDALYFLADFYGNTHYSTTFQEHLIKKEKYIDSVRRKQGAITAPKQPATKPEPAQETDTSDKPGNTEKTEADAVLIR